MTPLLSVVVPIHNGERLLAQCLESILSQTWRNMEVWLIDDGSTDASFDIILGFKARDSRIRIVRNRIASRNPGSPRNQALALATGDYLAFVDCDDWIEPEYFAKLMSGIHGHDIAWATAYYDHCGDEWQCQRWNMPKSGLFPKYHPSEVIWDKIYSLPFLKRNRIFLGTAKACVDVPFVCKAIYHCAALAGTDFAGYHYRRGTSGSTISLRASSACDFIIDTYNALNAWADAENVEDDYRAIMDVKMARNICYTLEIAANEYFESLYHLARQLLKGIQARRFRKLCAVLGEKKLAAKYESALKCGFQDWAEQWRTQC